MAHLWHCWRSPFGLAGVIVERELRGAHPDTDHIAHALADLEARHEAATTIHDERSGRWAAWPAHPCVVILFADLLLNTGIPGITRVAAALRSVPWERARVPTRVNHGTLRVARCTHAV